MLERGLRDIAAGGYRSICLERPGQERVPPDIAARGKRSRRLERPVLERGLREIAARGSRSRSLEKLVLVFVPMSLFAFLSRPYPPSALGSPPGPPCSGFKMNETVYDEAMVRLKMENGCASGGSTEPWLDFAP